MPRAWWGGQESHGAGEERARPSPPSGKSQGPPGHTDLRDHAGDVPGVGRQQEGVGVFGELGEGAHVLLRHRERGRGAAVLGTEGQRSAASRAPPRAHPCPTVPSPGWQRPPRRQNADAAGLPQAAAAHLLRQSGCQELNGLRLGPGLDQHSVGFSCNKPQQDAHQNRGKALARGKSGQFQGADRDDSRRAEPPLLRAAAPAGQDQRTEGAGPADGDAVCSQAAAPLGAEGYRPPRPRKL